MSDLTYTPTRQMAQSAAMKAQDAYALGRQAQEAIDDLRERVTLLEANAATLLRRLAVLEHTIEPIRPVARRKAA